MTFKEWFENSSIETDKFDSENAWNSCEDIYKKRLKEAEEVIAFYADTRTWRRHPMVDLAREIDAEDIDDVEDYSRHTGGKRARSYQQKYLTKDKP